MTYREVCFVRGITAENLLKRNDMAFKSFEKERKKSSRLPEAISFDILNVQEGIRVVFLTLLKQIVNYWMT